MRANILLPLIFLGIGLFGCQPPRLQPPDNPQQPYPPPSPMVVGDILHLPTGYPVTHETVIDHARRVQVVFVGETHDNPAAHRVQENILRDLARHNPGQVTLAMEMFTPAQQEVLDRWSANQLTEKDFLREVKWYSSWRIDFALYRDLLHLCREQGIKILALNAEPELKQKLSSTPIEALSAEEQDLLPELDFNDPYHEKMLNAFHAAHPMGERDFSGFRRVQVLWDETMAENLAAYLADQGPDHQVMVVAGSNHIRFGIGIPRRMFRRLPASYLLIGTTEIEGPGTLDAARQMDVNQPDYPLLPYHFHYHTSYENLPASGVKLGVIIEPGPAGGVLIERLLPGSAAEEHGLKAGDLLLQIEDESLSEPFDLIYALQQRHSGDRVRLIFERDGERQTLEVLFSAENQQSHGMR
jgi:uncharacterized iron-regulated protein